MKNIILVGVLCLVLIGCGVSKNEYEKVENELNLAKETKAKLETEISTLKKQVTISPETSDAIAANNKAFMEAFSKSDAAGVAALYTENGQLLPPNSDIIDGKELIQKFWQDTIDLGIIGVKLETVEVAGNNVIVCEIGKYVLLAKGDKELDSGKYIAIWKHVDGAWKMHRDIWNSNISLKKK